MEKYIVKKEEMIQTKKAHIITITVCIILFFYLLLICINYSSNKHVMERLTQTNQINMVKFFKQRVDEWLLFKKKIVSSTAISLEDLDTAMDYKEIKKILDNASSIGNFDSVSIGYDNNLFILNTDEEIPKDYVATKRDWYTMALQAGETTVTLPYQDAFVDKKVLSVVAPLKHKKTDMTAVVSADLNLNTIQQEILNINERLQGFAFLITQDGSLIVSPKGFDAAPCEECQPAIETIMKNKDKIELQTYIYKDQKYIIFYEPLKNSDWIFAMTLNENQIFAELNQSFFHNMILTIVFTVFGIISFYFFIFLTKKTTSYKRLLDWFAHSPTQAVAIVDVHYRILFFNYLFQDLVPLTRGKIFDVSFDFNQKSQDQIILFNSITKSLEEVLTTSKSLKNERVLLPISSRCFLIQYTPIIVNSSQIEGCIITINDITQEYFLEQHHKTHEQIMLQHSKIASMGEMLVAITHQWRQPLSALLILIGMIKLNVQNSDHSDAVVENKIEEIIKIIHFMEQTLHSFKVFYQPNNEQKRVNLAEVLDEVVLIMKPIAQINTIELSFKYAKNLDYTVVLYPNYLKQIIINLVSNAKDAIGEKSDLTQNSYIKISLDQNEQCYVIRVEDNGMGIQKEFISKLFCEMQTTKGENGTGNGLYLCKLLVENKLNGTIEIVSFANPTIFEVTLKKE